MQVFFAFTYTQNKHMFYASTVTICFELGPWSSGINSKFIIFRYMFHVKDETTKCIKYGVVAET